VIQNWIQTKTGYINLNNVMKVERITDKERFDWGFDSHIVAVLWGVGDKYTGLFQHEFDAIEKALGPFPSE
jgi:hypothetical protein